MPLPSAIRHAMNDFWLKSCFCLVLAMISSTSTGVHPSFLSILTMSVLFSLPQVGQCKRQRPRGKCSAAELRRGFRDMFPWRSLFRRLGHHAVCRRGNLTIRGALFLVRLERYAGGD